MDAVKLLVKSGFLQQAAKAAGASLLSRMIVDLYELLKQRAASREDNAQA